MEAVNTAASSVRMSPKVFSATMTSNLEGRWISCMAQLSTRMCSSSTSGYSSPSSVANWRQSLEVSSTLALSTEVSFPDRLRASSKPTRSTLSISAWLYLRVSTPVQPRRVRRRFLGSA